eukprot:3817112-Lingulodinium_polyedra.AAC.1
MIGPRLVYERVAYGRSMVDLRHGFFCGRLLWQAFDKFSSASTALAKVRRMPTSAARPWEPLLGELQSQRADDIQRPSK